VALEKWKEITADLRLRRAQRSAINIERLARGLMGRRLAARLRQERLLCAQKEQRQREDRSEMVVSSAILIQKVWRGYFKGRKVAAETRQRMAAVKVIQRNRRALLAKRSAL